MSVFLAFELVLRCSSWQFSSVCCYVLYDPLFIVYEPRWQVFHYIDFYSQNWSQCVFLPSYGTKSYFRISSGTNLITYLSALTADDFHLVLLVCLWKSILHLPVLLRFRLLSFQWAHTFLLGFTHGRGFAVCEIWTVS